MDNGYWLLILTSFNGQFVHTVGGRVGVKGVDEGCRYFSQLRAPLYHST